jgi:hypothetical protein
VLLRPAALPTGYYDPPFERSDLNEDGCHRLRHPSRLTAAIRIATAIRAARLGVSASQARDSEAVGCIP